jgi:hypothetical protein
MNILKQVTLDRANRKKDRSVSLTFITQLEQSSAEFMEIDELIGDSGIMYFKSSGNLTTEEIKELDNSEIEVEGKTVYHKQLNDGSSFNDFYSHQLERIIEHYKNKLDSE